MQKLSLRPPVEKLVREKFGDIMEARNFDSAPIKIRYSIIAPRGVITVEGVES